MPLNLLEFAAYSFRLHLIIFRTQNITFSFPDSEIMKFPNIIPPCNGPHTFTYGDKFIFKIEWRTWSLSMFLSLSVYRCLFFFIATHHLTVTTFLVDILYRSPQSICIYIYFSPFIFLHKVFVNWYPLNFMRCPQTRLPTRTECPDDSHFISGNKLLIVTLLWDCHLNSSFLTQSLY